MLSETEMAGKTPSQLRWEEADYFLNQYERYCGPPIDSYFGMIAYLDAFLFCYISLEEMVGDTQKKEMRSIPVFKFLKASRNITTHRMILAAPVQTGKHERPFRRVITESTGSPSAPGTASAELRPSVAQFRCLFDLVKAERPRDRQTLNEAQAYLDILTAAGTLDVTIQAICREGLDAVAALLAP